MTAPTTATDVNQPSLEHAPPTGRRMSWPVLLLVIAGALALTSIVRLITGANGITNVSQMSTALQLAVPIGLAGLGGLWAERAGVVNIGLEGMMILGTWFGAWLPVGAVDRRPRRHRRRLPRRPAARHRHDHLQRQPHRLRCGHRHPRPGRHPLPRPARLRGPPGRLGQAVPAGRLPRPLLDPGLSDWLDSLNDQHWFFVSDIAGLAGGGPSDVVELTLALAREMLDAAGLKDADPAKALADGSAMDVWRRMIAAQGGDPDAALPTSKEQHVVKAASSGVLTRLDAYDIGVAAWRLGAGRARKEDPVQAAAGVELHAKPGDTVTAGQPLLTLHTDTPDRFEYALAAVEGAYDVAPAGTAFTAAPVVRERIA
ncbi:Thymidine phosphorylase [Streptomyces violaceorubidus]